MNIYREFSCKGTPLFTQNMQRDVLNGHQNVHAIKFHTVVTPKGIIEN